MENKKNEWSAVRATFGNHQSSHQGENHDQQVHLHGEWRLVTM